VVLIGDGAGVVYSKLGISHQCSEDISALRALPNIRILSPCDKYEMKLCMEDAIRFKGPTYIRVGKSDLGSIHTDHNFAKQPGIHQVKKAKGDSPVILATGSMVKVAQNLIEKEFTDYGLYSVLQIKPMNEDFLLSVIGNARQVITMEEHNVLGGLGSVVTEILSAKSPRRVLRIGIEDRFTDKCGTYEYLMQEHKLDSASISAKIKASQV
jgi:transketolase